MSELLLIGKELPDCLDFAESLSKNGRKIFTTSKDDNKIADFEAENIFSTSWNKASAISSRALLIKNETKLPATNEYIIAHMESLMAGFPHFPAHIDLSPFVLKALARRGHHPHTVNELFGNSAAFGDQLYLDFCFISGPRDPERFFVIFIQNIGA